ncbi:MAG: 3-phosphoshikimate 1-carboxyvinyltransferase [Eubacteriales bacterium]|nr:3-phosphoshikimate 1-carboxyvinyltransferase [Eubacteriales bacterium]
MIIKNFSHLKGEITVPGDKSISHRSIMLGSLAKGTTEVTGFLQGADCLSSISCFHKMGISIENDANTNTVKIHGKGLRGLESPFGILDVGNSGTTTRLMSGILAAQPFSCIIDGDASIRKRPMARIMTPLSQMGAKFESLENIHCAPFKITGGNLKGIDYNTPVASAQIKSAILLAGLYADGPTSVTEPYLSRNHTELMLSSFGADIKTEGTTATVLPAEELQAQKIEVPGDISSAAYFIAAGLLTPNSEITIKNVGINPTRDGIITVCKDMGANITLSNIREASGEPVADITVSTSSLHGCVIEGDLIPKLIDEIPIIAIMAAFASGTTIIRDAAELKVKESNRIDVMVDHLTAMGVDIEGTEDGMIIRGGKDVYGTVIDSKMDHRIAMSFAIAGGIAIGATEIMDADVVNISYPNFFSDLEKLSK